MSAATNPESVKSSSQDQLTKSWGTTFGDGQLETDERDFIKFAHLSNELVRLKTILETFDPGALKETLLIRLQSKDPQLIVALSSVLPRHSFPADNIAHCVRCHKQFNPKQKSNCVLMHPNKKVSKVFSNTSESIFMCHVCNTKFKLPQMFFYDEKVNSYYAGLCFQGHHTVNPMEVIGHGAVTSCEEKGCIECFV